MKKKNAIIVLSSVLAVVLVLGAVNFIAGRVVEEPETKKVLINYMIDGQTEPFDFYYSKHKVGDQLRVVSPQKGGYQARVPIYTAKVKSDMNITIKYDFKAPDLVLPDREVYYYADFNTTYPWYTYMSSIGGLRVSQQGNNGIPCQANIINGILYMEDRGHVQLRDDADIFLTDEFTVSCSMLFKGFNEVNIGSMFSFYYLSSGKSVYNKVCSLDTKGNLYLGNSKIVSRLETDHWYKFDICVNTDAQTCELFVNGISYGITQLKDFYTNDDGISFRLFNTDTATEYYLDNFVIYEGNLAK